MAKTGYGKRSTGDEDPHADADFAHLSPREREIAVFLDHLDNGHSMAQKVLAAEHPRYGQQAFHTALTRITEAGHLRWIKEHITVEDNSMRWVTRTYWSRTRRPPEWWAEFARERDGKDVTPQDYRPGLARVEDEPPVAEEATPEAEADEPDTGQPSDAYCTLALLRVADPRMPLSEADCKSLEPLAAEWLSRGATPNDITHALTDGLPPTVTNPGGLARRRLETKMPPQKTDTAVPPRPLRGRIDRVIMACATCDQDERTVKIDRGICEDCRRERPVSEEEPLADPVKVIEQIAHDGVMAAYFLKRKLERRTGGPVPDTFRPVPADDYVFYHFRDNRDRIANGLPPRRWNW